MKRGKPLSRGTPLARGDKALTRTSTPLARTPMARTSAKPYPTCSQDGCTRLATRKSGGPCPLHREAPTAPAKPAKPGIPAAVRAVVLDRAAGRCEACGGEFREVTPHLHHRLVRARGDHSAANLVALHPKCHVVAPEAVHQRPAWARGRGLIIASGGDPLATPVTLASGRRVLLDSAGPHYIEAPEAA